MVAPLVQALRDDPIALASQAATIRAGALVVHPTETVYGIGCALSAGPQGIARLRACKRSSAQRPFLLLVADTERAFSLWSSLGARARELAASAWPGPLTMVGPAGRDLPPDILGEGTTEDGRVVPTVSVRVPGSSLLLLLLHALGEPLLSSSANIEGEAPSAIFEDVAINLLAPDLALDGGTCAAGVPSTVLSLLTEPPTVLRAGAWSPPALWP